MPKTKKKKKKVEFLVNVSLLFGAIILFLLFSEIVLIIVEPKPKYKTENQFLVYEYDEILGWKNKAFKNGTLYMPDSKSYVQINSKGLRDIEHEYKKPKGIERIQFYGDSFTWGYGVDEEERYTSIFRSKLDKCHRSYEIINLGITGYGTDQEYLSLTHEGLKYNPDIIVFAYHNDLWDVSQTVAGVYPKPKFIINNNSLELTNVPVPKKENWTSDEEIRNSTFLTVLNSKLKFFRTYNFVMKKIKHFGPIERLRASSLNVEENKTQEVIDAIFLEVKRLSEQKGLEFVIVLLPSKGQVFGAENTRQIDHLVEFGKMNNITVINLLPKLKDIGKKEKEIYFEIDGHFSERGNKIVGDILFKEFIDREIIDCEGVIFLN